MYIHTKKRCLSGLFVNATGFVGNPVFRAGDGCLSLAVRRYCAVHAWHLMARALDVQTREGTHPINLKGRATMPEPANTGIAKLNTPCFSCLFMFALKHHPRGGI
jgi:hypothetical protein